ncbi:MAG: DUF362 domain-containing protein [Candidatus Bathyarchaeia archaeon]
MENRAEVAIAKDTDIKHRTVEALKLIGGIDKVIGRGDKVFLKPNLVDGAPFETGEVVQLEAMEALVQEAFRAGATEVTIGEVPTWRRKTKTVEEYERLAERLGAKFLDLNDHPFEEVEVENPVLFSKVRLSKPFLDSDVFISVPTLKTHAGCGITVAIKNMYGLISREDRMLYHMLGKVEEAILDLYQARKADLTVADGTYTTIHLGPRPIEDFKETFKLNLTLAGFDPVAMDTVGATILGIDPETLRYLKWAEERGLGTSDMDKIKILGVPIDEAYFGKAVDTVAFFNARMKNVRILNYGACTGCIGSPLQFMRFGGRVLKDEILFVMGPGATASKVEENVEGDETVILCGHCAAPTFYNELQGEFIPGCPPAPEIFSQKLKELFLTSNKPRDDSRLQSR